VVGTGEITASALHILVVEGFEFDWCEEGGRARAEFLCWTVGYSKFVNRAASRAAGLACWNSEACFMRVT
jgi:hypothetical protein